jgi:hypothetical protein
VADENAIDVVSSPISGTITISSVIAGDNGAFEFTSSVVDADALGACLEASDAVQDPFVMVGSSFGPFSSIQVDAVGPLPNNQNSSDGIQWIDTAVPHALPNAAQHFNNLYHHPPFGMIPEDGYQSSDSSMPLLVGIGRIDEWDDDDYDSDSSTDTIPIQAMAANDSDFNQSDLDDDYEGYSSDEWDASGDTEEAAALPLNQQLDEASEPQPLIGFNARTYAAVALHQALNDVEAYTDAADALHSALRVAESRVACSVDSCSGALE